MNFKDIHIEENPVALKLFHAGVLEYIRKHFRYSHDLLHCYSGDEYHITWKSQYVRLIFNYTPGDEYVKNIRIDFPMNDHTSEEEMLYPFKPGAYNFFQDVMKCFCEFTGAKIDKYFNSVYFDCRNMPFQEYIAFKTDYSPIPGGWDSEVLPHIICRTVEQIQDVLYVVKHKGFVNIPIAIIMPKYVQNLALSSVYEPLGELSPMDDAVFLNIDGIDIKDYIKKGKYVRYILKPRTK